MIVLVGKNSPFYEAGSAIILVCYMTNLCICYLLLCNIPPQTQQLTTYLLAHSSLAQKFQAWHDLVLCSESHKAQIKVVHRLLPHLEPLKKSRLPTSFRLWVESFFETIELRFQFPCRPLLGGYSQLPEAARMFLPCGPLHL